jgi:hypothetical protein
MIKSLNEVKDFMRKESVEEEMAERIERLIEKVSSKKNRKPIYIAAFLTNEGQNDLKNWWESNVRKPLHSKSFMHHMTIKLKPSMEEVLALSIGEEVGLSIVGFGEDEQGQAVAISTHIPVAANIPHITVSTAEGVSPVYSNKLLENNFKEISGPTLMARIGYWNGKEAKFDYPEVNE